MWQQFNATAPPVQIAVAVGASCVLAAVAGEVAARLFRMTLLRLLTGSPDVTFRSPIVRRPIRIMRGMVFVIVAALLIPAFGVGRGFALWGDARSAGAWLFGPGIRVLLVLLVTYVAVRLASAGSRRLEHEVARMAEDGGDERLKRVRTLGRLVQNVVTVAIVAVAILMVLAEFELDITPILTGAGIVGLAVGFGAQALVRDVISGFFLILEDQVRVGDVAVVNGIGGLVEAINLRTIVLRDLEGTVHVVPNGAIATLANRTRDYSFSVVDVGVAYKEDTDRVVNVLQVVGEELARDPAFAEDILAPLEVLGVDDLAESQVTIKSRIKTRPLRQWAVGRELRRRVKKAFDASRIEIPFPHVSVYFGEASRPFAVQPLARSTSPGAPR